MFWFDQKKADKSHFCNNTTFTFFTDINLRQSQSACYPERFQKLELKHQKILKRYGGPGRGAGDGGGDPDGGC